MLVCVVAATESFAQSPACNGATGLVAPLPACSVADPCNRIAAELPQIPITTPSDLPICADPAWDEILQWNAAGFARAACVARPAGVSIESTRPLIVWLHPGGEGADNAEQTTLLAKSETFDLSGDPARPGFVLVAPQGRNLHFPTLAPRDGRHHDFYYRDLSSPSSNPDVASLDVLIDDLVATGTIDKTRIYIMGWSNGGFFGQLYGIARHETATPNGARVAAAVVFATADPFNDVRWDPFAGQAKPATDPSCQLSVYPASSLPLHVFYRSCDRATPCGTLDAACFGSEPGYVTSDWLVTAASRLSGLQATLLGGVELGSGSNDQPVAACSNVAPVCTTESCQENPFGVGCLCLVNHLRWPDGDYPNGSGVDREPDMLGFLAANPLAEEPRTSPLRSQWILIVSLGCAAQPRARTTPGLGIEIRRIERTPKIRSLGWRLVG